MTKYAENTSVSTDKSLSEIRQTLRRYGADGFAFGEDGVALQLGFKMKGRQVRFRVPLPDESSFELVKINQNATRSRSPQERREAQQKAIPQLYRALLLVIKAKLESVESGIETFDQAFMAHLILSSGETMSEWMAPQAEQYFSGHRMPPLLASGE